MEIYIFIYYYIGGKKSLSVAITDEFHTFDLIEIQGGHWKTENPLITFLNKIIKNWKKRVFVKVIFV